MTDFLPPSDEPCTDRNPFDWTRARRDPVGGLQEAIASGASNIFDVVPKILRPVLEQEIWRRYSRKDGEKFSSFEEFVTTPLWWGLESTIPDLVNFCKKHPDLQQALLRTGSPARKRGRPRKGENEKGDNIPINARGTSEAHLLSVLKRDDPALADRVIEGEMSAHAAMVGSGRRTAYIQASSKDMISAAKSIAARLDNDDMNELIVGLIRALRDRVENPGYLDTILAAWE